MKYSLIGDRLREVHGENRCREVLATQLRDSAKSVVMGFKCSWQAIFPKKNVVLFPGESARATLFEKSLVVWYLITRRNVSIWFHNGSISRWVGFCNSLSKLRVLVLQRRQCSPFKRSIHFPNAIEGSDYSVNERNKTLVWLSRLDEEKGIRTALSVYKRLRESDPEWKMAVIGGDGSCTAAELDLENIEGLTYHGRLDGDAKFQALASGGILLFPSAYENETQPLVVVEAMSVGLPVVISNVNGIGEILGEGTNTAGVVVTESRSNEYVSAIQEVWHEWDEYHARAMKQFSEGYSMMRFANRCEEVFQ